ncbi:septum formation inhibitor Maf [Betaproteobacteria bacterium UKL13-2]|nr:septum formation inhibitor Maf [Betaproteobacteria bacterium UKL13-2]HCG53301.1 septum formation protein Maf [Betaproteobacteria bacterium]
MENSQSTPIVLASTSRYRAELLSRLQFPFTICAPECDESRMPGERCEHTALRIAIAKAQAAAKKLHLQSGLVIGSDQVADLNGQPLGKPGTRQNAVHQLTQMRGQTVLFHTGVALLNAKTHHIQSMVVLTTVQMRNYSDAAITYYLEHENALDCAGSAKSEGLGAALIMSMRSDDPTALIGLPLLALISMLSHEGFEVLR